MGLSYDRKAFSLGADGLGIIASSLGGVVILSGYRRHRQARVLLLMGVGLLLIFAAAYWGSRLPSHLAEVAVTMMGSCFMIAGHFLNHTFCKSCARCNNTVRASETNSRNQMTRQ